MFRHSEIGILVGKDHIRAAALGVFATKSSTAKFCEIPLTALHWGQMREDPPHDHLTACLPSPSPLRWGVMMWIHGHFLRGHLVIVSSVGRKHKIERVTCLDILQQYTPDCEMLLRCTTFIQYYYQASTKDHPDIKNRIPSKSFEEASVILK